MPYPTDGFSSQPISLRVTAANGGDTSLYITVGSIIVDDDSSSNIVIDDDLTQALFTAISDSIASFVTTNFPTATITGSVVTYEASKTVTL